MKKVKCMIRNVIFGAFILYGYNLIAANFNMVIPINYITLIGVTILGVPSLMAFILFKLFIIWEVNMNGLMET